MDDPIDFQTLAREAAQEAYEPRAKKCWLWSHQWTMWREAGPLDQRRRCVRCGLIQEKRAWSLF